MQQQVRWAILGAGRIARTFASDFSVVRNATLSAVASRDKEKAAVFAAEYNIPLHYTYEELYQSKEVDAVYVATPHNFHYQQCIECLQHGKHVLCEKPITLNDSQFVKLVEVAKAKNVFLMEAMWTYFLPPVVKAMEWLKAGRIGSLKVIDACFGVPMPKNLEGRLYNINLAGGALLDLGVYPVAFTSLVTGQMPGQIVASGVLTSTGVDERTAMVLQFGDVTAHLFTSIVNIMNNKSILYGDKGYIEIPEYYKTTSAYLYDDHHQLVESFIDDRTTKGFNFEIQDATDCIAHGKSQSEVVTHERSLRVQQIMTEVRRQIGLVYPGE